ncbi:hypothetical protein ABSA28_00806 [Candidatus Hepatincolaceae symbiont of Richtersius coronifer]
MIIKRILLFTLNYTSASIDIIEKIYKFDEIHFFDQLQRFEGFTEDFSIFYKLRDLYPKVEEYWDYHFWPDYLVKKAPGLELREMIRYEKLILYSEGIVTYLSLFIEDKKNIDKVFLLYTDFLNAEEKAKYKLININKNFYFNTLDVFRDLVNTNELKFKQDSIFFLSSILWSDELDNTRLLEETKLIKNLISKFKCPVYYKKHPRSQEQGVLKLRQEIREEDLFIIVDFDYPVGIILRDNQFKFIISYFGSSLLSSYYDFNTPVYTFNCPYIESSFDENLLILKEFVNNFIPNIENYISDKFEYDAYIYEKTKSVSPFAKLCQDQDLRAL